MNCKGLSRDQQTSALTAVVAASILGERQLGLCLPASTNQQREQRVTILLSYTISRLLTVTRGPVGRMGLE